jgi:hypothetical protein
MQRLSARPKRVYVALVVALVAFFGLSAVGNTGTKAQNAHSSVGWIGSIGWGGFMLTILATVLFSLFLLGRKILRTRREH